MQEQLSDQEATSPKSNEPSNFSNFEPTAGTKDCYFAVRKKRRSLGRIELPGLFDYQERYDQSWTVAVLLIEVIALFFLARVISESSQDIPLFLLGLGAMAFLAVDFAFAYVHHFIAFPYISKNENELLCVFPSMRPAGDDDLAYIDWSKQLKFQLPVWRKNVSRLCVGLLCLLAIVKCVLYIANVGVYFANTSMPAELQYGINILVFLAYFFCVYAHIFHTGYYLAYRRLKKSEERDRTRFYSAINARARDDFRKKQHVSNFFDLQEFVDSLKATGDPKYTELVPKDESDLKEQINTGLNMGSPINTEHRGGHKIIKNNNKYQIRTNGLLTDDQLAVMVENQGTDLAQAAVALWGHYIQYGLTTKLSKPSV